MYESPSMVPLMQEAGSGSVSYAADIGVWYASAATIIAVANSIVWANLALVTMVAGLLAVYTVT